MERLFINQMKALPGHKDGTARENFLTASFAGTLAASTSLRQRVVQRLVGRDIWNGHRISRADIGVHVEITHEARRQDASDCRVDLVLDLNGASRIGVEIKLQASEGVDADGRKQVDRYLALRSLDAVAYLTADAVEVSAKALRQHGERYLVPRGTGGDVMRQHFLWADFYPEVEAVSQGRQAEPMVVAFKHLMEYLQLRPVHPLVGELGGRAAYSEVPSEVQENRDRMRVAMQRAAELVRAGGWETTKKGARTNGTLYAWRPDLMPPFWRVQASTNLTPGAFRLWIEVTTAAGLAALEARLLEVARAALGEALGRDVLPWVRFIRSGTTRRAADLRIPLKPLLSGVRSSDGVGQRLGTAMLAVSDAAFGIVRRHARARRA